jgi:hypothetical protein
MISLMIHGQLLHRQQRHRLERRGNGTPGSRRQRTVATKRHRRAAATLGERAQVPRRNQRSIHAYHAIAELAWHADPDVTLKPSIIDKPGEGGPDLAPPPPTTRPGGAKPANSGTNRFACLDAFLAAHHPNTAHHHLAFLAVDPARRSTGLGIPLIRAHLALLTPSGTAVYAPAATPTTRAFDEFSDEPVQVLREMPVKTEWDRAARAFLIVTIQQTVRPAAVSIKPTRRFTSIHHY